MDAAAIFREADNLRSAGDLAQAEERCRDVLKAAPGSPSARFLLAQVLLAQARWGEGWPLYEARIDLQVALGKAELPIFDYPRWRGEGVSGCRVLVLCEQGFGDQIQFARYVPALVAQGAVVTLLVPPALAGIFDHFEAEIVVLEDGAHISAHDFWIHIGSLPGLIGGSIPASVYLPAHQPIPPTRRIGVVWQGRPTHINDANRSFRPEVLKPLLDLGVRPVPLAPELSGAKTFAETARIIDQLDAVVTVDTAVAHLAGAMGRPVYIALPHIRTDWRWMRDRSDSPWYPSARLYRQGPDLDWMPVVEAIRDDLSKRYAGGT